VRRKIRRDDRNGFLANRWDRLMNYEPLTTVVGSELAWNAILNYISTVPLRTTSSSTVGLCTRRPCWSRNVTGRQRCSSNSSSNRYIKWRYTNFSGVMITRGNRRPSPFSTSCLLQLIAATFVSLPNTCGIWKKKKKKKQTKSDLFKSTRGAPLRARRFNWKVQRPSVESEEILMFKKFNFD